MDNHLTLSAQRSRTSEDFSLILCSSKLTQKEFWGVVDIFIRFRHNFPVHIQMIKISVQQQLICIITPYLHKILLQRK